MANIFDYLAWRADVPFSVDPFNEVDALVLSELSYTDFGGIVEYDGDGVPIGAAFEKFFSQHTKEDLLAKSSYTAKAPILMEEMAKGARFCDMKICRYVNFVSAKERMQMSAVTYLLDDGTAFVAFRGTDGTVVGWKEDFDLSYLPETEGQSRALAYLNRVGNAIDRPLRVGGHSKGGNFAVYASAKCDGCIKDRIISVYTNDGPGFRREFIDGDSFKSIVERIVSIVPDTSVIGMLMSGVKQHMVVKSSASGIIQHDGFSWDVLRNRFIETESTNAGIIIKDALDEWLSNLDEERLCAFTDSLFSLFEQTGEETFSAMSSQKWKSFEAMISAMSDMPKDKQQNLLRVLGSLIQSGGHAIGAYLQSMQKNNK